MKVITPDYYGLFKCTANKCPDNCCIGWEIDIDSDTYNKYLKLNGAFGEKLRENITLSEDKSPCFKLNSDDRCPFLNERNLCDIIINAGEDHLCNICADHPRFHNCFGNIRETGIGISCIEAAKIVLSQKSQTKFIVENTDEFPYDIDYNEDLLEYLFKVREKMFSVLQDRSKSVKHRFYDVLTFAEYVQNFLDNGELADVKTFIFTEISEERADRSGLLNILKSLIPLNDDWSKRVNNIDISVNISDFADKYPIIIEQLAVYYLYRHFMSAVYDADILSRVKFTVFCCLTTIIMSVNASDFTETACLVSKEIEYCSENIDAILDYSYNNDSMRTERLISLL